ncbi:gas vesicle synthesis protein [Streptomyces viridochromogenes]|uniref:Gas vesicle synthesis protein n=1 Tax=Streptomyces viridochromogenes TaxID=1938 RepID=A0A0J8BT50_STRVR|nr:gas vesicle protein [Streptomyces viridochromogenes]KMS68780.1 gas vesicle synthesis protein [Streptomyces viridochromogenes]KOG17147.1 gas vesicle synthesis protein [Streptomyces viridochromogenes]KOG20167.1 gas vesicle synthesis protein [Streptomyces viridochromogenes]
MTEHDAYDDDRPLTGTQVALIDLLDRLLSGGVVITGDVVLSIADIDLVRISLRAVVIAVREQLEEQWAPVLPDRTPTEYDYGGHGDTPG